MYQLQYRLRYSSLPTGTFTSFNNIFLSEVSCCYKQVVPVYSLVDIKRIQAGNAFKQYIHDMDSRAVHGIDIRAMQHSNILVGGTRVFESKGRALLGSQKQTACLWYEGVITSVWKSCRRCEVTSWADRPRTQETNIDRSDSVSSAMGSQITTSNRDSMGFRAKS